MIVSLARILNLSIVAEGVETDAQLHILSGMGDMLIQGYLISPPVPVQQFQTLLVERQGDRAHPE